MFVRYDHLTHLIRAPHSREKYAPLLSHPMLLTPSPPHRFSNPRLSSRPHKFVQHHLLNSSPQRFQCLVRMHPRQAPTRLRRRLPARTHLLRQQTHVPAPLAQWSDCLLRFRSHLPFPTTIDTAGEPTHQNTREVGDWDVYAFDRGARAKRAWAHD